MFSETEAASRSLSHWHADQFDVSTYIHSLPSWDEGKPHGINKAALKQTL